MTFSFNKSVSMFDVRQMNFVFVLCGCHWERGRLACGLCAVLAAVGSCLV